MIVRFLYVYIVMLLSLGHLGRAAAVTNYVVTNNPSPVSPYTDWNSAATNIQDAVNAAVDGNTVLVSNGTYTLTGQITIAKALTVRSLNGAASTIINGNGSITASRCFYTSNTNILLDGFSVINGTSPTWHGGGGIRMQYGGTIQNCIVTGNQDLLLSGGGGGVKIENGTIQNCIIQGNFSTNYGGGVYATATSTVRNCTITSNRVYGDGGGIYLGNGSILQGCTISYNRATNWGGGGVNGDNVTIRDCIVIGNRLEAGGERGGGGIYLSTAGTVQNCLIVSNWADSAGGGVLLYCAGNVESCTIASNSTGQNGGGFMTFYTNTTVRNSIIYFNISPTYSNYYDGSSVSNVSYSNCCFSPAQSYTNRSANNITSDPKFLAAGNYRLDRDSPCVNNGTNQDWMTNAVDIDGRHRIDIYSGIVDMGCYEYLPSGITLTVR